MHINCWNCLEKVHYNNKLYIVLRKIKEEDRPIIQTWKDHLRADISLRYNGLIYFCKEVMDVDWEDIK